MATAPRTAEVLPASAAQRRFWLTDRLEGPSGVYNTAAALRLRGPLATDHLRQAFQLLVDRHEALRTVFPARDGVPVQLVLPRRAFELGVTDAAGAGEPGLRELAGRLAEQPFDLAKGPLLRAELIALGPREHLLVVVLHHIVVDRWSFGLLMSELSECYAALAEQRPVRLPALPLRYADHVAARQAVLDGGLGDRLLDHWRERLAGAPQALELPGDCPRPAVRSFRGATVPVRLDAATSQAVRDLARAAGATPYIVLLAAFQAVLARHAGTEEVVVATGPATRAPGTELLVGALVNTVLLRTSLAGDPSFTELLERVRGTALDAFEHQELPFDRLVEALAPSRDLSRNPLAQVGFVLQNAPATTPALTGLAVEPVSVARDSAHLDLDLQLTEEDGCFTGFAEFARDLFEAPTVARLLGHWTTLLGAAVRAPGTRLSALPLLTPEELERELHGWNDTDGELPAGLRVDQLFARQAARTPEAVAVVDASGSLDYRTLDAWAARIAHRLREHGVGPEVPVALCLERGAGLSAAMLGTLRAGGAFLGLDPSYPADRLAFMIDDARPAVVLAHRSTAGALPAGTEVLLLEEIAEDGPEFGRGEAAARADASGSGSGAASGEANLAYLVYTSGSTGRPKGVAVTHRAIVNTFAGLARSHGFGPGDRMIALHSPSFDPAVHDCLAPLLVGAAAVFPAPEAARDPRHWAELVARHRVTVWCMGPAGTEAMLAAAEEHGLALDSLRTVLVGGDVLPPALPPRLRAAAPGCQVVNSAGVAEAAFCNNEYRVPEDADPTAPVPYGHPLPNQRLLVLDALLRAVPAGVPGELCVAGEGLARGYLGRPGLTAERFVPHPYGRVPGERLYRTGDLARRRADGELELLGRADHQVKIRGFRVEPGEVTGVLLAHPAVADAIVVAREVAPGDRRLAAYWVPATDTRASAAEVAAWLRERLPGHLVPALWTELTALPLSPNGKVDRAALPAPAAQAGPADRLAPRTADEAAIAAIWQRLLELPEVGVLDDFFTLGGHSLLANRLVGALRAEFGVELRLREVFGAVTVAAQAELVGRLRSAADEPLAAAPLPPVVPVDRAGPLPLSFAQQRMWLFDRFAPGNPAYHVPTAVRIGGALDHAALAAALRGLTARHEVLRTVLPEVDGVPTQRVLPVGEAPLTVRDLAAGERPEELVDAFVTRPFDLAAEPPLRALLLRTAPDEHVLVLVIHHIALDGWSMGVLVEDLGALYDGRDLPPLPVQYADYARWQADRAAEGRWTGQLEHWRERLAGPLPVLELPADRPRPAVPSLAGAVHGFELPAELTERLRALGARHGATLFMVLLAGYQTLLGRLSGAEDVLVGTPVAGRGQDELDGLVGCFVNSLALRGDLSGDPAFTELLERTRDRVLTDFDCQDVPFEQVLDAVGAERDPARHPVFQTMLTLQSARPPRTGFAGLRVEPVDAPTGSCLMDLMLTAVEQDGRLAFTVEYATDLFDAGSIARLAHRFGVLLAAAADAPGTRLSGLPLLDAAERRTVLTEWNDTARPVPAGGLHELVAAAAARTPDAPALEHEGRTTRYAELEAAAERCAAWLRALGVGPGSVVAVRAAPTPLLVTALLGVMKAGAAFTTLDPELPEARLRLLLELSGARLVLTDGPTPDPLPDGLTVAPIEAPDGTAVAAAPGAATEPEALACVFFTSGTTGTPKGSMFTHRGLVNFTLAMAEEFRLAPGDRFLQLASTGFDVLVEELFPALAAGATVVLPGARLLTRGVDLTGYLAEHRITGLELTTAYWHDWTAELERTGAALPPGLRFVAMGGERVRRDRLAAWQRLGVPLVHVYGLTEVTCTSATRRVTAEPVPGDALPIGRPLPNTTVLLLDGAGQPVPIGSPGELFLGGAGLARGYLGRPGLTAERFVPDPYGEPGARLYRTGDLARHRADGEVEFIGRADQQVKIRGHRIEPGEVEARLAELPGIAAAAVIVREDEPGEKRLVGYAVAAPGTAPEAVELRAALRERLPEYLVPSAVVLLPALPLNGNGKLDRGALPRPGRAELAGGAAVAPRTPAEREIAELAGELLDLPAVGVHDNLFDLGLHSLLAARFAARVREACRVEVPLRVFYKAPTVAELALRVVQLQAEDTDPDDLAQLLAELEAEDGLATA